ncbi:heme o synthase [Paenibacillus sp.]|uniref:heme o synthase n=1 Tax=Paenibacillus sp. TaxID=58172 RepID=UPI002D4E007E|nr:heme o synthase [Paenibacillus sp.]HZG57593.1 heme o synthase [Paenibacillus sp.]
MDRTNQVDASAARDNESAATSARASWKQYYALAKPRMIMTNLITAFGGFWVASKWDIDWLLLIYMLAGSALVMGSGCVFNNVLDRERDQLMERTKQRAIPTGAIPPGAAMLYGSALGVAGLAVLYFLVGPLAALLGIVGHIAYVIIYTYWLKPTSTWSTSVGGISGAVPPVIGYCAVTQTLDLGAILLFGLLFFWQPPHFWALGIRKREEYKKAGYPLLPVVKGVLRTKWQMVPYLLALYPTTVLLYTQHYVGLVFLVGGLTLLTLWTWQCLRGFTAKDDDAWAMRSFKYSLYYLTFVFVLMVADTAHVPA